MLGARVRECVWFVEGYCVIKTIHTGASGQVWPIIGGRDVKEVKDSALPRARTPLTNHTLGMNREELSLP